MGDLIGWSACLLIVGIVLMIIGACFDEEPTTPCLQWAGIISIATAVIGSVAVSCVLFARI